jgi:ribosomal protein S18 acetylase RimI-like enzyme
MIIRRASLGDWKRLAEIHVLARYDMKYLPHLHSFASAEKWMRETVLPRQRVWVAEVDGAVVGYASLHDGFLTNLYLHPSYQGQGIGAQLLTEVRETTPDGFKLWVFQANHAAIRFYERHGAITVRVTDGSRNAERLPDRLMCFGSVSSVLHN